MARAQAFYRDIVGLQPGELSTGDWIEFDLGNATFAIDGSGAALGIAPGSSSGAGFEVDDIEAMRRRLLDAGVDVTQVYEFPPCFACFARDPDGNRFALHKRKG